MKRLVITLDCPSHLGIEDIIKTVKRLLGDWCVKIESID